MCEKVYVIRLDLVLICCKSASDNGDKGLFFIATGSSIELPGTEKIKLKL